MAIITISRGSFTGGKTLAECLSKKLGYRCIDRDVIVERAAASGKGVTQQEIREALERPPGFFERFSHRRYVYLALIQAALTEEVKDGKAIYHGLAGHLLLHGGPHILRTRVIAPVEQRVAMVRERLKYGHDEAVDYIHRMDEDRRKWTQLLYGVNWEDSSLYDVVINLEHLTIENACTLISTVMLERCFEFTPKCRQCMEDFALASRVRAELALDRVTGDVEVETSSELGVVCIRGRLNTIEQLEAVRRVASAVPGVSGLDTHELMVPMRS